MPGRIFFRDARAVVTSIDVTIGEQVFPLNEILGARGVRRRRALPLPRADRFALVITTAAGDREVLRESNGYMVFQLAKAIETALKETGRNSDPEAAGRNSPDCSPESVA